MANPTITAISMIILRQVDIAAAVAFYQSLGFKLKFHLKDAWAELSLAGTRIGLCPVKEPVEYRTGIVLEVSDLRAFYAAYQGKVEFLGEPKEALHGVMIAFKDLSGNILDVYEPTPDRVAAFAKQVAEQGGGCCQKAENIAVDAPNAQCCKIKPSSTAPYCA